MSATITETYQQMKARHEREVNEILRKPSFFAAFSDEQFRDGLDAYLAAGYDKADLRRGPAGTFAHKDTWAEYRRWSDGRDAEIADAMRDHEFAVSAFYGEMCNVEYAYNYDGFEDVVERFDYKVGDWEYDEDGTSHRAVTHRVTGEPMSSDLAAAFNDALAKYHKACDENGWW